MNTLTRLVIVVVTLHLLSSAALAVKVVPPLRATIRTIDGVQKLGDIVEYDENQFTFQMKDATRPFQWTEIQPSLTLALNERLTAKNPSATHWLGIGRNLLAAPGGSQFADRAFAKALRLDNSLARQIQEIKVNALKPASKPSTGATTKSTWGDQTEEEMAKSVAELKQQMAGYSRQTRARLTLFETKYFLFYSDLQQSEAMKWSQVLDRMYARLAELFDVPKDKNLWLGKAVIVVFVNSEDFEKFEKDVFRNPPGDYDGFCHQSEDGRVFITFNRSSSELDFARTLVHESTHGFIHRYRSPVHLTRWVNEGLAEVISFELVPHAGLKQSEDARARDCLRLPDPLQNLWENDQRILGDQYPIVRTLTEYMITLDKKKYVQFVNDIKDGKDWKAALQDGYGMSLEDLIRGYGTAMGMPNLRP